MEISLIFFVLLLFNLIFIIFLKKISNIFNLYDYPNFRKKHENPTALLGGVLLFLSILNLILFSFILENNILNKFGFANENDQLFFISSFIIFLIGIYDDKKGLTANLKLFIIALLVVVLLVMDQDLNISNLNFLFLEKSISFSKFTIPFTVLCFVIFINAFNMFDGIDLQASLYSFILLIILIFKSQFYLLGIYLFLQICFIVYLNYKKKIFLGDNGSLLLAFIFSYLIIKSYNYQNNNFYADEIFLIMLFPGLDMIRLTFLRLFNKKHPFKPDNEHIHHYLMKKFNLIKTNLLIQSSIVIPLLFYYVTNLIIVSILIKIILYLSLIYVSKKN